MGSNKKPFFRIVATDERCPQSGRYLEMVGWYDPKVKGKNYELKMDRVDFWKNNGAIISDSVQSLLKRAQRVAVATAS